MHSTRTRGRNVTGRRYNIPMPEIPPGSGETVQPRRADVDGPAEGAGLPPGPAPVRQPRSPRPLPDAVAVRELIVPDSAPPFDDEPCDDEPVDGQPFDDKEF